MRIRIDNWSLAAGQRVPWHGGLCLFRIGLFSVLVVLQALACGSEEDKINLPPHCTTGDGNGSTSQLVLNASQMSEFVDALCPLPGPTAKECLVAPLSQPGKLGAICGPSGQECSTRLLDVEQTHLASHGVVHCMVPTHDDSYYLVGIDDSDELQTGNVKIEAKKLDADGAIMWNETVEPECEWGCLDRHLDPRNMITCRVSADGSLVATVSRYSGVFLGKWSGKGELIEHYRVATQEDFQFYAHTTVLRKSGAVVLAGAKHTLGSRPPIRFWWATEFGGSLSEEREYSVETSHDTHYGVIIGVAMADGGSVLSSSFSQMTEAQPVGVIQQIVLRLDVQGNEVWRLIFDCPSVAADTHWVSSAALHASGGEIYWIGWQMETAHNTAGGWDRKLVVARIGCEGALQGWRSYDLPDEFVPRGAITAEDGRILVYGIHRYSAQYDPALIAINPDLSLERMTTLAFPMGMFSEQKFLSSLHMVPTMDDQLLVVAHCSQPSGLLGEATGPCMFRLRLVP